MKNLNAQTAPRQSQTNSAQIVHKFVSQSFDLTSFKELLTQMFPRIHFTQERKEILQGARLKSYTTLCEPLKLSVLRLSVGVFECENIRAKISIHTELKELLKKSNLNAILAVFYAPKQSEFRLSLITSGFDYETNKASFSNLKRQSFILGHDKTATAQRVLLKLIDTAQNLNATRNSSTISSENLSLKDLENAFSQEPISKEFYKDITACFLDFLSSVKLPANVSENDKRSFVLRLLCRLLFCKFLEKKGLIKAEIWDTGLSKNYYFEILQTLFFATLNTEPNLRDENELYTLLTPEIKALLSTVPYLNGGLFSPQKNDFFNPDKPFVYLHELSLPNSAFDKLFELFHQYNFTLDEQSAFDTEVALDPELLGTVFESLLCELFTESKGKDLALSLRKSTGSYYTPREIVSYMVKSALLEQLKLKMGDEKGLKEFIFDDNVLILSNNQTSDILRALKELKILDPACGSGAFPMGILNEILHLQEKCGDDRSHYERKLEILQHCIYGVDIQPMATEIARLRCFLSLIIDEDINDIKPLPNLEFKFISANSLLPLSADTSLHYDGYHKDIQELERLRNEYFNSQDKTAIQKQYLNLRERITREDLQVNKNDSINNPMLAYDPFDPQSVAQFFDSAYMFGVESFDIVIGNPPYGAKLTPNERENYKKIYKQMCNDISSTNTAQLFILKAQSLLKDKGINTFIVPKSLTYVENWKPIRDFIQYSTTLLADCSMAFVNVKLEMVVYLLTKGIKQNGYQIILYDNKQFMDTQSIISQEIINLFGIFPNGINKEQLKLGIKICQVGDMLKNYCKNSRGITHQKYLKERGKYGFIGGKEIDRYGYKKIYGFVDDIGEIAKNAFIKDNSLLVQNIVTDNHIVATLPQDKSVYLLDTINQLVLTDLNSKLLWAILNSTLMNWYIGNFIFANAKMTMHFDSPMTNKIPIPKITNENQNLVDKILDFKKADKDITELESKIDDLVYQLYSLNKDEISIINA